MTEDDEIEATTYLRCNPQPGSLGHMINVALARIVELKTESREARHKWANEMQVRIGEADERDELIEKMGALILRMANDGEFATIRQHMDDGDTLTFDADKNKWDLYFRDKEIQ